MISYTLFLTLFLIILKVQGRQITRNFGSELVVVSLVIQSRFGMRSTFAIIALLLGLIPISACTHTDVYYGYKLTSYTTDEKLKIILGYASFTKTDQRYGLTQRGDLIYANKIIKKIKNKSKFY